MANSFFIKSMERFCHIYVQCVYCQVLFSHPVLNCITCKYHFHVISLYRMLMKYLLETSVHYLALTVLVETHSQTKIIVDFLW